MYIRKYEDTDTEEVSHLFKQTILHVNQRDYSKNHVMVWSSSITSIEAWAKRLKEAVTYVATTDNKIVGFCNVTNQGEVDLLYVHKDYQRQGIASKLLEKVEQSAKLMGIPVINTEASITAKPFFEAKGYCVIKEQHKKLQSIDFVNYLMEKNVALQ